MTERVDSLDMAVSADLDTSPAVSIGLAVRNGRPEITRCIESVLSQDFADLELVISDNVSDDGTIEIL